MEKKTIHTLREMVCKELEEFAKKSELSENSIEILRELLSSMDKLNKIEDYEQNHEMMDEGYSQAMRGVYYIDGDYSRGRNYYDNGRSMGREPNMMNNNSYSYGNYYDMYRQYPKWNDWGRSNTGSKEEMINELKNMADQTEDTKVKAAIFEALGKIEK